MKGAIALGPPNYNALKTISHCNRDSEHVSLTLTSPALQKFLNLRIVLEYIVALYRVQNFGTSVYHHDHMYVCFMG